MRPLSLALIICVLASVSDLAVATPRNPYSGQAQVDLGYSGARLVVTSTAVAHTPASDHRVVTLVMPDGRQRKTVLHDGGGELGNNSLNLYFAGQDHFRLVSEKDCLDVDPIEARLRTCPLVPLCNPGLPSGSAFLGRFDYMNGFDSPKGVFGMKFRFLWFYDARCG